MDLESSSSSALERVFDDDLPKAALMLETSKDPLLGAIPLVLHVMSLLKYNHCYL